MIDWVCTQVIFFHFLLLFYCCTLKWKWFHTKWLVDEVCSSIYDYFLKCTTTSTEDPVSTNNSVLILKNLEQVFSSVHKTQVEQGEISNVIIFCQLMGACCCCSNLYFNKDILRYKNLYFRHCALSVASPLRTLWGRGRGKGLCWLIP